MRSARGIDYTLAASGFAEITSAHHAKPGDSTALYLKKVRLRD
jgi:hypothetical protein